MNQFKKSNFTSCRIINISATALVCALLLNTTSAIASSSSEEQSLARGAIEDVTPQQQYRTAIREAGGGYKEWLRECTHMQIAESRSCRLEAKATYDRDMAKAKLILRDR